MVDGERIESGSDEKIEPVWDENIEPERVRDLLYQYAGRALDLRSISDYDRASMAYFTDPKAVRKPRLNITFPLDVTGAHRAFKDMEKPGDTFTGYLTWGLLAAMRRRSHLSWRHIEGVWYAFEDLPLFIPVATGIPGRRLTSVILKHVAAADWRDFSHRYRSAVEESRSSWSNPFVDQLHWSVYHFIGNLPGIQFTSFTLHESGFETARPLFYLGQRYEEKGKLLVPFAVQFHHATLDPILLGELIADFQEMLTQGMPPI